MPTQRKTSTAEKLKACRVLSRRAPDQGWYTIATLQPDDMPRVPRAPKGLATSSVPIQDPHEWPPYGGVCWRQAYDEARAWNALIQAATLWAYFQSSQWISQDQKNAIFSAYVAAKTNYQLCWQVMEDCLTGMVA